MIWRVALWAMLLTLWMGFSGCSEKGDSKNPGDKPIGRPPVAVEVTKVIKTDFTEGIEVVGSLSPKFGADVKSEYCRDRDRNLCQ